MNYSRQDKRLAILERLMVDTSTTRKVPEMLGSALTHLLSDLENALEGASYLLAGEVAVSVGSNTAVGEALANLLQAWWAEWAPAERPQTPQVLDFSSYDKLAPCGVRELKDAGAESVLIVPLNAVNQNVGYLALAFGILCDVDNDYWGAIGRTLGLAVDDAKLYQDVEQRLLRSQALYEISRTLSSTLSLDHILGLIVISAVNTVKKASNGVLHLLDEETGELRPRALSFEPGVLPDAAGDSRMRLGQGVAGMALQTGRLVNIPDVDADPRFIHTRCTRRFASMLVVPLLLGERRIGTLSLDSDQVNAFDEDDEQMLVTLAAMAAVAIDNARLVSDLHHSLDRLKATQEQLLQSAKLSAIGQLIAGVAHELNNPLTAVMGYTQLLQMTDGLDDNVRADLDKIYAQASRAAGIVENLLTFARQSRQEGQRADVNEVIRRALELRGYQLRRWGVKVVTNLGEGALVAKIQADHLQQVFLQLMGNAQEALSEVADRDRVLSITTERDGGIIRIRFQDNGPGLSPEAETHLFEPFFTTKEVGEGAGLGLSICFGIVNQYGGRIYAQSERDRGATFVVELPVAELSVSQVGAAGQAIDRGASGILALLVIEDQAEAERLEAWLLQDGHRVMIARDLASAIDILNQAFGGGGGVDVIVVEAQLATCATADFTRALEDISPGLSRRIILLGGTEASTCVGQSLGWPGVRRLVGIPDAGSLRAALDQVLAISP